MKCIFSFMTKTIKSALVSESLVISRAKSTPSHIALVLTLCISPATAQQYYLYQTATGTAGGLHASSMGYSMNNTVGQKAGGSLHSSGFLAGQGIWWEYNAWSLYSYSTYAIMDGWNLISLPRVVADYRTKVVLPSAASRAYSYTRGYVLTDTLELGRGYWIKFSTAQAVKIEGSSLEVDTFNVEEGWNIVGSLGIPVSASSIVQIPANIAITPYFSYDGAYEVASTLDPTKGYWVKCRAPGKLILNASGSQSPPLVATYLGLNVLTIAPTTSDKSHAAQSLYFASSDPTGKRASSYEMPPVAPTGFDVRFASNRYAEFFTGGSGAPKEIPILIATSATSVIVSYTLNEHGGQGYTLVEEQDGKIVAGHSLVGSGEVTLTNIAKKTFTLKMADKPIAYALAQNFPNPFNPTTVIQFSLPSAGHVSLKIFNTLGQEVATLIDGERQAGYQSVQWNAASYASGVYFYRISALQKAGGQAGTFTDVKKMVLLR